MLDKNSNGKGLQYFKLYKIDLNQNALFQFGEFDSAYTKIGDWK